MNLQTRKEKLDALNRRLRHKKVMAILLALFTLGVNVFAWFVFSTHTEFEYDGTVTSWDVQLREGEEVVNDFIVAFDMKPGMATFQKEYEIDNSGGVVAKMSYTIDSIKLMGRTVDLTDVSDPVEHLRTFYPFVVDITSDKTVIPIGDTATIDVVVDWDFEDSSAYFALNNIYDFDQNFVYYKKNGSNYETFEAASSNYDANRSTMYLGKDDADTYFGMQCGVYQDSTDLPCLEIKLLLTVEQNS